VGGLGDGRRATRRLGTHCPTTASAQTTWSPVGSIGTLSMAFSGSCTPVPGGEISPGSLAAHPPAIAACKNGETKGSGSISGSPSLVPWTGKASWTGARLFWMGASCPAEKGKGRLLIPMRSSQKGPFLRQLQQYEKSGRQEAVILYQNLSHNQSINT
jgi:hypothetical protein